MTQSLFSSSDTDSGHGMAATVWHCHSNHCLNHNLSGQRVEVRTLQKAGVNAPIPSCSRSGVAQGRVFPCSLLCIFYTHAQAQIWACEGQQGMVCSWRTAKKAELFSGALLPFSCLGRKMAVRTEPGSPGPFSWPWLCGCQIGAAARAGLPLPKADVGPSALAGGPSFLGALAGGWGARCHRGGCGAGTGHSRTGQSPVLQAQTTSQPSPRGRCISSTQCCFFRREQIGAFP